jgi:DNA-binding NarL/FixJ family response regulator
MHSIKVLVVSSRPPFLQGFQKSVQQHEDIRVIDRVIDLLSVPYRVTTIRAEILLFDIPLLNANAWQCCEGFT